MTGCDYFKSRADSAASRMSAVLDPIFRFYLYRGEGDELENRSEMT